MEKVLIFLSSVIALSQHFYIRKLKREYEKLEGKYNVDEKLLNEIWQEKLKSIEKTISTE